MTRVNTAAKERRVRDRRSIQDRTRILWIENGLQRQTMGEIRDLSPRGMSCWAPQRIPASTEIRLECATQRLNGDAVVRHCNNKGARFLLGIEFMGSLTWRGSGETEVRPRWD